MNKAQINKKSLALIEAKMNNNDEELIVVIGKKDDGTYGVYFGGNKTPKDMTDAFKFVLKNLLEIIQNKKQ